MLAKKNLLCALVALAQAGVIAGVLKVRDHVAPDYTAYLNHHEDRLAVKSRHYVESKKIHKPSGKVLLDTWAGMENYEWCAEQCVKSLKCISFEVAQPNMKKRFNKKRFKQPFAKCELHSYIMNEAIRKTKTCRRSTCGVLTPRAEEAAKLGLDQWRSIQTPPPTALMPNRNGDSPLPPGWERAKSVTGETYFVDHTTETAHWQHPSTVGR
eukprot:gene14770-20720_t